LVLANFAGSFRGLPQEVVDEILECLVDDGQALRACSLTCKALLRSSRPIIHRRLCVVSRGIPYSTDGRGAHTANLNRFRALLAATEHGLTRYTRELTIKMIGGEFKPVDLQSFLPQFQTFGRLTSLTLHNFKPAPFLPAFEQQFGHLAQQIQSLKFVYPSGPLDDMLSFISRFPNLDDLRFYSFPRHLLFPPEDYIVSPIRGSPTLRGTLQATSMTAGGDDFLRCLTRFPSGLGFRSIEFHHCTGINPNIIIQECSSTLQYLTHTTHINHALPGFDLSACSQLRVFEIRIDFTPFNFYGLMMWLALTIHTIASPGFHKFVLVVEDARCPGLFERADGRDALRLVDQALWNLSQRTGMKMTVREISLGVSFCNEMEKAFPLMASAGGLEFKVNDPPSCLY